MSGITMWNDDSSESDDPKQFTASQKLWVKSKIYYITTLGKYTQGFYYWLVCQKILSTVSICTYVNQQV